MNGAYQNERPTKAGLVGREGPCERGPWEVRGASSLLRAQSVHLQSNKETNRASPSGLALHRLGDCLTSEHLILKNPARVSPLPEWTDRLHLFGPDEDALPVLDGD